MRRRWRCTGRSRRAAFWGGPVAQAFQPGLGRKAAQGIRAGQRCFGCIGGGQREPHLDDHAGAAIHRDAVPGEQRIVFRQICAPSQSPGCRWCSRRCSGCNIGRWHRCSCRNRRCLHGLFHPGPGHCAASASCQRAFSAAVVAAVSAQVMDSMLADAPMYTFGVCGAASCSCCGVVWRAVVSCPRAASWRRM